MKNYNSLLSCKAAVPYYNFKNKYLLYKLLKLLNLKTAKDFIELIKQIYNNDKVYIFEKHIKIIIHSMFASNKNLIKVIIPDSVVKIKCYAFSGCENLENVIILNNNIIICPGIFMKCEKLTKINILNSDDYINIKNRCKFNYNTMFCPEIQITDGDKYY